MGPPGPLMDPCSRLLEFVTPNATSTYTASQPAAALLLMPVDPLPTSIHQLLHLAPADHGATALAAPGRASLDHGTLREHVRRTAAVLRSHGIESGDRIAVVLPNGPEMATTFLAVTEAAICAPLNPAYGASELEFYFGDLDARAVIVPAGSASAAVEVARARAIPVLELTAPDDAPAGVFTLPDGGSPSALPEPPSPDRVALVLHTSGTTSRPKMVPLRHRHLAASAAQIRASLALGPADRCLNVMPLFHIHGLVAALLASLSAGGSVFCTPGFFVTQFLDWLDESGATWYTAVPTMHQAILARAASSENGRRATSLRFVRSSSAALPPKVLAELERTFGVPALEAYGMTEAAHQMATNPLPPRERRPGSVGLASGTEVAIMDDAGTLLPPDRTGEVVVRGANVMDGYERNPEANSAAFSEGWFRTGDQGHLDAGGYLYLTGRRKEIINRGGEKISPREIDEVLLEHPAVAEAVAFAVPHESLGEAVAAAVVLRSADAVTASQLRVFAAAHLAHFKVPERILLLAEIPKGPTGKIQRIGLAERLGITSGDPSGSPAEYAAPTTPLEERVCAIWAEILAVPRVGIDDDFFLLGGDSMLATRVAARLREQLGVELPLIALFETPTVRAIASAIEHGGAAGAAPSDA